MSSFYSRFKVEMNFFLNYLNVVIFFKLKDKVKQLKLSQYSVKHEKRVFKKKQ